MRTTNVRERTISLITTLCVLVLLSGTASAATVSNVYVGAWFGTTPNPGNGVAFSTTANDGLHGGSPAVSSPSGSMANGVSTAYNPTSTGSKSFTITPESGYRIKEIRIGRATLASGNYTVATWSGASTSSPFTYSIPNSNNRTYIIWVVFEQITYSVASSIVDDTPVDTTLAHCSATGSIGLTSAIGSSTAYPTAVATTVAQDATQKIYIFNTNPDCEIDGINFVDSSYNTSNLSGRTSGSDYTTPAITSGIGNAMVWVKFRHKGYTISVTRTDTTPSCGTVSPVQSDYEAGASQTFTVLKNANCAIDSVLVDGVDVTATVTSATNPTGVNTYRFSNIQANHTVAVTYIKVSTTLGAEYCQRPPFMLEQATLKPNVLIILDNSGSMGNNQQSFFPYNNGKTGFSYGCTYSGVNSTLDSGTCKSYYGYFDNEKMYNLVSGKYMINTSWSGALNLEPPSSSTNNSGEGMSGNYLNYRYSNKVDILRKILVGGRVDDSVGAARGTTGSTYYLSQNDGKLVEYGTTEPTGIVQSLYDKVRFGIMNFNTNSNEIGTNDGGYISAKLGSSLSSLVSTIEGPDSDPTTNTPLAESLYEAVRYYEGMGSAYNSLGSGVTYGTQNTVDGTGKCTAWDGCPSTDTPPELNKIIQYACQKNFVLMVTDGEPTKDHNIPGNPDKTESATDSVFNLNTWWDKLATADQPAKTSTSGGVTTITERYWLPAVAYFAHNTDLRSSTVGTADMSGKQNISLYTVYAFGDGSGTATLKSAAKYGAYKDINNNGVPDSGEFANGYYEASDGAVLEQRLKDAFANILDSAGSGTAAAVANNKSGQRGANLLQALFYPQWPTDSSKKWMGEVQALWFYLDPVIGSSGIYQDSDNDDVLNLVADELPPSNPFQTKALWRAGAELHKRTEPRSIYTLLDSSNKDLTAAANMFSTSRLLSLRPRMNLGVAGVGGAISDAQANYLIDYIRGTDRAEYRPRKVTFTDPRTLIETTDREWKLGDIVNSTPQVQSSVALNAYHNAYADMTYKDFIDSPAYKSRNVVYSGSNDGLFHAFKLGTVTPINQGPRIAGISGTDRGKEEWAFIPGNALPYIQNQAGVDYCHQSLVDGAPIVVDASINNYCSASNYWDCDRVFSATNSSWKTVVVSSMGLGGASRDKGSSCNETYSPDTNTANNKDCVKSPVTGNGMSSYFALDVTDPLAPKYMWEFSDTQIPAAAKAYNNTGVTAVDAKGLGLTTPGAAIIRINPISGGEAQKKKNGRWFAVMASGPTGEITGTQTFTGHSDQNLKIYIVDINGGSTFTQCTGAGQTGCNYWVKDTGIPFAFANSLNGAAIDLDRWNTAKDGNYSDDVVYITYTKASLTYNAVNPVGYFPSSASAWNKGGIIRLVTNHNPDPFTWFTSPLIDDTGPISTSVGRLQDRSNKQLWVFFGEGRSFYPGDETDVQRRFFGVADPCYTQYGDAVPTALATSDNSDSNYALGKTPASCPAVVLSNLQNQDTPDATAANALKARQSGWYINMAASSGSAGAERIVSDVSAAFNGVVFYTTYIPNNDPCVPGGSTSLWAVNYNSGGTPASESMQGKAPVQTSSGGVKLIDLATSFTQNYKRKLASNLSPMGMAPKGKFPQLLQPRASKRIINIQEK